MADHPGAYDAFYLFRYVPEQELHRELGPAQTVPVRLIPAAVFHSRSDLDEHLQSHSEEGTQFVVYQAKGRAGEDGVPPRLELAEKVAVKKPSQAKVSTLETLKGS